MHICVFSGEVSYLSPKDKKNPLLVLKAIENDPNVSTWDMGEHDLWRTVYGLVERGLLIDETKKVSYPWHRFVISDEGRKYLAAQQNVQRTYCECGEEIPAGHINCTVCALAE